MWETALRNLHEFGTLVGQGVLWIASGLRQEHAPGLVCVVLVAALVLACIRYFLQIRGTLRAIRSFTGIVARVPDASAFQRDYIDLSRDLNALEGQRGPSDQLGAAWREYAETLEPSPSGNRVYNAVRPSVYFNREDLGIEDGFWRHVPALFVSVGLFLTFLGLVAALEQASTALDCATRAAPAAAGIEDKCSYQTPGKQVGSTTANEADEQQGTDSGVTGALQNLLSVASAKFIMSLTGLACSILFTIALRFGTGRIDHRLLALCNAIEKRVLFRTPESLLALMLAQQVEQTEQMKGLLPELVAQLGRPLQSAAEQQTARLAAMETSLTDGFRGLNEGVPAAIRDSMIPIMERLEQNLGSTTRDIADGLSGQLTAGMQEALSQMGRTMEEVGASLSAMAARMDSSSNTMAGQVDAAVAALAAQIGELRTQMAASAGQAAEVLNEGTERLLSRMDTALQAIQQNTENSGQALERAGRMLREAATEIAESIRNAGTASAEAAGAAVRGAGTEATTAMGEGLSALVGKLSGAMSDIENQTGRFAEAFRGDLLAPLEDLRASMNQWREAIQAATAQSQRHADAVSNSAGAVELANTEITRTTDSLARATTPMAEAVDSIKASNRELARAIEATAGAIETALQGMQTPQAAMLKTLEAIEQAVDDFSNIVNRYQDIDSSLGRAFQQIRDSVSQSVQEIGGFAETLNTQSAKALTDLRSVVEQIEPYRGPNRT